MLFCLICQVHKEGVSQTDWQYLHWYIQVAICCRRQSILVLTSNNKLNHLCVIRVFWGPSFSLTCSHLLPTTYYKEAEFQGLICGLTIGRQGIPVYRWQCHSLWALLVGRIKTTLTTILLQNWPCYFLCQHQPQQTFVLETSTGKKAMCKEWFQSKNKVHLPDLQIQK